MNSEAATILAGAISGALGGTLAVFGALRAVRNGIRDLEEVEIRRQRVSCITSLHGLRFILSVRPPSVPPRPEDIAAFSFEINKAGLLFADDMDILKDLRDFREAVINNVDATALWVRLIRKMGAQTRLHVEGLSDSDLTNAFYVQTKPQTQTGRIGG